MKTLNLNWIGYYPEEHFVGIPTFSGVYVFQECYHNREKKEVSLRKILYIGQAVNCKDRVSNHEKIDNMKRSLSFGNVLCVNVVNVVDPDKSRAEAALIYKHKPPFNDTLKNSFDYDKTSINNSGRYSLLIENFTIVRSLYKQYYW